MDFPIKLKRKDLFLLVGLIIIWLFPLISILVYIGEYDPVTGLTSLLIGIISSISLYIFIKIAERILPTVT